MSNTFIHSCIMRGIVLKHYTVLWYNKTVMSNGGGDRMFRSNKRVSIKILAVWCIALAMVLQPVQSTGYPSF